MFLLSQAAYPWYSCLKQLMVHAACATDVFYAGCGVTNLLFKAFMVPLPQAAGHCKGA
jgi:hypothetical protein